MVNCASFIIYWISNVCIDGHQYILYIYEERITLVIDTFPKLPFEITTWLWSEATVYWKEILTHTFFLWKSYDFSNFSKNIVCLLIGTKTNTFSLYVNTFGNEIFIQACKSANSVYLIELTMHRHGHGHETIGLTERSFLI